MANGSTRTGVVGRAATALVLFVGGIGCEVTSPAADDAFSDAVAPTLTLTPTILRAFPQSSHELTTPFPSAFDACQDKLHVVLEPSMSTDELDVLFRHDGPPTLVLQKEGQEIAIEGDWLERSAMFELDDAAEIEPGLWTASIRVNGSDVSPPDTPRPQVLKVARGDVNRDGRIDSGDLVEVFQAGKYEADQPATPDDGDVDCNGRVDSSDLVAIMAGDGTAAYEGASYAAPPADDEEQAPRQAVVHYNCWLASYEVPRVNKLAPPPRPDTSVDYVWMDVKERSCSSLPHDPEPGVEFYPDASFPDPTMSGYVAAHCGFENWWLEEANERLAKIGESYHGGTAELHGELNVARTTYLYCEPQYGVVDDENLTAALTPEHSCIFEIETSAVGRGESFAYSRYELDWAHTPKGESQVTVRLEYPGVAQVASATETSPPPWWVLTGTADTLSPALAPAGKCELGFQLGSGWLEPKVECFLEIDAFDPVKSLTGDVDSATATRATSHGMGERTAIVHLASSKKTQHGLLEHDGPVRNHGELHLSPLLDGPQKRPLGKMGVNISTSVKSNALSDDFLGQLEDVMASQAHTRGEGKVDLSLAVRFGLDGFDELSPEEQDAWLETHAEHCSVSTGGRTFESPPAGIEKILQGYALRARGSSLSISSSPMSAPYCIDRQTHEARPMTSGGLSPDGDDFCGPTVCCEQQGGQVYAAEVTEGECMASGNEVLPDTACEEVCCWDISGHLRWWASRHQCVENGFTVRPNPECGPSGG